MMSARMTDGQKRTIRKIGDDLPFHVVAYRVDSDTPYVILRPKDPTLEELWLDDGQVEELIERLNRALNLLPSSK